MTDDSRNHYLVFGATGFQGGAVARLLLEQGHTVRGFSRNPAEEGRGVEGLAMVHGDLADAGAVRRAFEGITHAALVMPLVYDTETVLAYARNIADAAKDAGVERLVYNVNTPLPEATTPYASFETRRAVEAVLRESGLPLVVVRPPVYLDNLFSPWTGPALVNEGVLAYPLPAGQKVAWLSHADLAAAVVAALGNDGLEGRTLDIGGAEVVTGPELAEAFAEALGREVTYLPLHAEDFEAGLGQVLGAETAQGVAGIYRWAATGQDPQLFAADPQTTTRELGIRLTPLAEWIAAQPWQHWAKAGD
ncbi:SDR family oxidoreductase [Streptomyces sp. NPDC053048]|uniref:SDR family oxidoreductase n=1 Tax=Streptomyces sp. NPDC053048 TaxID=3365694 RepID=UPI0037D4D932